jgi:hypothetical protein
MRRAALLLMLLSCGPRTKTIAMHEQNNSGQNGTATLVDLGAPFVDVTEVIQASTFPGAQASHIHLGHCDDLRNIEFYISWVDGGFESDGGTVTFHAVVDGGWDYIFDGDHAINVHDPRDNQLYVSCGDLQ